MAFGGPNRNDGMHTSRILRALIALSLTLLFAPKASAQSTCAVPVESYITSVTGEPLDDTVDVALSFYLSDAADAVAVDCRHVSAVVVSDGWMRVVLDACALPPDDGSGCGTSTLRERFVASDDTGDTLHVGIRIGDDPDEITPRIAIGAVPFAVRAGHAGHAERADDASTVGGLTVEDIVTAVIEDIDASPPTGGADLFASLDCAEGDGLIYDADAAHFVCLNLYDKDDDDTPVWEDCDDLDPVLNRRNDDGDQSNSCDGDCDDADGTINPANTELCGTGVDENCDGVMETADFCLSVYFGGGQTVYQLASQPLPDGDAATWYQSACEAVGLHPVSCDPEVWGAGYDASAYGAVPLDPAHYGCNVSTGVMGLTGWTDVLTFHMPGSDTQGVCQNGCTLDGDPVHPLCTP